MIQQKVKENLKENIVIKNYKKLCELLGENIQAGKAKQLQEKNWQRYFNYEKEGQKYIITKLYNEPLPKIDQRKLGNNAEYIEHIKFILLNYLSKQEGYTTRLTLKKLFLLLGMINNNYMNLENKEILQNDELLTEFQINHFYQRTYDKLKRTIFSSLNNLQNNRLIMYEEIVMISININNETIIRNANDKEKELILLTQKDVLNEMGLESIVLVYLKFKQKEFYKRVNELLLERYNINYSYIEFKIIYNHKNIIEAKKQAELEMQKRMLNDKMIETISKQANNILKKNKEEYEDFIYNDDYKKRLFVLDEDIYLYSQKKLTDLLIKYY